ncbi:hypothetical protein [Sinomicrobium pectinilyticum]|uniref:Uncharacterized protein n=1 Tax=Sinomicrobium pectinilyticum TaxID=1084421 RepID=A0A3N0E782_SINP1|nr:hypothetical protein [Sinomicrobium pectinilyticum]RNL83696.1 hypothetical protein ED312_14520 [Sinomicrobium pectinilyticum]
MQGSREKAGVKNGNFEGDNTFEEIQGKIRIEKQQLINIHFNTGAPEPYVNFCLSKKSWEKNPVK